MGAREMLEEVSRLDYKVKMLTDRIIELEAMLLPGIEYDKIGSMPKGYIQDNHTNIIYKISDTREVLIERRAELFAKKSKLMRYMAELPKKEYIEVLDRRYFNRQKWEVIADEMHYSYRYIFRLCDLAITELDKIIGQ